MQIFSSSGDMRRFSRELRAQGHTLAFVPTMGYLHEGHLSLVREALQRADRVVVSIYVNPTQFAPHEDFDVYPRDSNGDRAKLEALGCHAVYEPTELFPPDESGERTETRVRVVGLEEPLCGVTRPHFFPGVATVVTKLFHVVEPDIAIFGKKDYQQWRIIERLVHDLDFPIEIVGCPLVREADGLAMSSRNVRLSPDGRQRALSIVTGLREAAEAVTFGRQESAFLRSLVVACIERAGGEVDYVEVADALTLKPVQLVTRPCVMAVAAVFGGVRLIDNMELTP
jgi:pantoate--beta-alanine ligase